MNLSYSQSKKVSACMKIVYAQGYVERKQLEA